MSRPAVSAAITAVMAEWTWVERGMASMVGNAFGFSVDPRAGWALMQTNPTVLAMIQTAETIRARFALMDATIGKLLHGTPLMPRWEAFKKDAQNRSRERNRLAHAAWMISDDFPDDLIEFDTKKDRLVRWTEKDVLECLSRMLATRKEAHDLLVAIVEALHDDVITEQELGPRKVST